ncbi:PDZ domain-containing protein [Roseiterribacter gracilis]|uniref:PDZ domain-containing protein n=1 Tax=Roseiterribacter gracilis TaxID=2812848 RepID=A0A8S8XDL7_9PROT|nr:hypothetical protein TMPK1_21160 [Rhodospirillales bacterium TMPK1]
MGVRAWRLLIVVIVVCSAGLLASVAPRIVESTLTETVATTRMLHASAAAFPSRLRIVTAVDPNGPAAAAGLQVGDQILFRGPGLRAWAPGETLIVDRMHADGKREPVTVTLAAEHTPGFGLRRIVYVFAPFHMALALLLAWRRPSGLAPRLLTLGLALYSFSGPWPYAASNGLQMAIAASQVVANNFADICFAGFAVAFAGAPAWLRHRRWPWTLLILWSLLASALYLAFWWLVPVPESLSESPHLQVACAAIVFFALGRKGQGDQQHLRWLLAGFVTLFLSDFIGNTPMVEWRRAPFVIMLLQALGLSLLVYTVLRARVLEFRVAVNRTAVFSATSLILIGAFSGLSALGDRVLHNVVAVDDRWLDILIAAGLAVVATRLRRGVERGVEALLFRDWRARELRFRAFLEQAGHFNEAAALLRRIVAEISAFAGTPATLYLQDEDGRFLAFESSDTPPFDGDDALVVELRASRRAWRGGNGALAVPMQQGGLLSGFVLLAAKPEGQAYRSDEVALLERGLRELGFELQALRAVAREREIVTLRTRLDEARAGRAHHLTGELAR